MMKCETRRTRDGDDVMDIEMIREKLATDNRWLVRGIVAIYERQTLALMVLMLAS